MASLDLQCSGTFSSKPQPLIFSFLFFLLSLELQVDPELRQSEGRQVQGRWGYQDRPGQLLPLVGKATKPPEQWAVTTGHTWEGQGHGKKTQHRGGFALQSVAGRSVTVGHTSPRGEASKQAWGHSSPTWLHHTESVDAPPSG